MRNKHTELIQTVNAQWLVEMVRPFLLPSIWETPSKVNIQTLTWELRWNTQKGVSRYLIACHHHGYDDPWLNTSPRTEEWSILNPSSKSPFRYRVCRLMGCRSKCHWTLPTAGVPHACVGLGTLMSTFLYPFLQPPGGNRHEMSWK